MFGSGNVDGLSIPSVIILASVVMVLVTVAQLSEAAVILRSVTGFIVVYVPIGRLLTIARLQRSLALLKA